jgi:pimeloyl-ACP methyl ester carboxylesterase
MFAEFDGKPVAELEAFASRYGTRFIGPPIPSEGNPENKGKEPYFFKALIEVQGYEIRPSRRSTACLFREGRGGRSFVFVHGWTCDQSHFTPQMEAFCRNYHVIAVDLRGHGQSDKPQLEYTLELFAGDIAAICGDRKLEHPILVGHSMGGTIALEVATRYPDLLSGIVLIDTVLQPDAKLREALKTMYENLLMDFSAGMDHIASLLQLPSRDANVRSSILKGMNDTPREVALSAFEHHLSKYDSTEAILSCRIPSAYSQPPVCDRQPVNQS